jgi:hypothetical protein
MIVINNLAGKGGFGEVLKARNKLDNRFYAVSCSLYLFKLSFVVCNIKSKLQLRSRSPTLIGLHWATINQHQIKKIPLPVNPREETKILREVTILSRLVPLLMTVKHLVISHRHLILLRASIQLGCLTHTL